MNPFEKMDMKKDSFIIYPNQQLHVFVKRLVMMDTMNLNLMYFVLENKEILQMMIYLH